ncbi:hypothetical protein NC652_037883 [Populus alba x Populus x berolinensis]|nr:hypothetical protein NC652_037883 [Populus alba x Populus x berolinensis]
MLRFCLILTRENKPINKLLFLGFVSSALIDICQKCGEGVYGVVLKAGLDKMVGVENTLLDAYAKCGEVGLSRKLFDEMTGKDVVSWNSMSAVYAQIGLSIDAFEVFHGMLKDGGGKCDESRRWFNAMSFEYNLEPWVKHYGCMVDLLGRAGYLIEAYNLIKKPGVKHYGCMVDLLGRAGYLIEAYNLIKSMQVRRDFIPWGSLLAVCRIHKNVELAEISAKGLFKLDPTASYYVPNMASVLHDVDEEEKEMVVQVHSEKLAVAFGVMNSVPGSTIHVIRHLWIIGNKSIHEKNKAMVLMKENAPTMNSLTIQLYKLELQSPLIAQSKRQPIGATLEGPALNLQNVPALARAYQSPVSFRCFSLLAQPAAADFPLDIMSSTILFRRSVSELVLSKWISGSSTTYSGSESETSKLELLELSITVSSLLPVVEYEGVGPESFT